MPSGQAYLSLHVAVCCCDCTHGIHSLGTKDVTVVDSFWDALIAYNQVFQACSTCFAGQRGTVLFAGGAGMVVLVAVPLSLFARFSLAVLTVGNVLFWKACMPTKHQTTRKV